MGVFHVHCVESGLALKSEARLLPILERSDGQFEPCAAPITAMYDYYGGIDVREGARASDLRTVTKLGRACQPPCEPEDDGRPVWHALSDPRRPIRWEGRILSYVLFDEGVALAMGTQVSVLQLGEAASIDLFGQRIAARDRRWLAALRQAGPRLVPIWTSLDAARQYAGVDTIRAEDSVQPLLDAARLRYRDQPAMLRAVGANERGWREMDDDGAGPAPALKM